MTDASDTHEQNVRDLARVMTSEAGGKPGEAAQIAVGWCLRNRMMRNGADRVRQVWSPAFTHRAALTSMALRDAAGILDGTIPDPTDGATHFYTPQAMPKEGGSVAGRDVGGGLESVVGVVVKRGGPPVRNYRPAWSLRFVRKPTPEVPEQFFKFYRQPGTGHVH